MDNERSELGSLLDGDTALTPASETPPQETPPAETPPVIAPPAETPPAETPPTDVPPLVPPADTPQANAILAHFKEKYNREYKNEEALAADFEKVSKYSQLETDFAAERQKYQDLESKSAEAADPMKYFANDDEYVRQQFIKANAGKIDGAVLEVMSSLSPEKISNLSDTDAIKLSMMKESPDLAKNAGKVEAWMKDKYGIENFDNSEWDAVTQINIMKDAKAAKSELTGLFNGIEVPEKVDYEAVRTSLKESWTQPLNAIVDGVNELKLTEDLSFAITPEMKKGFADNVLETLISSGIKPTDDAAANIAGRLRSNVLEAQLPQIIKVIESNVTERVKQEYRDKVHNPAPLNSDTPPPADGQKSDDEKLLRLTR